MLKVDATGAGRMGGASCLNKEDLMRGALFTTVTDIFTCNPEADAERTMATIAHTFSKYNY